MLSSLLTKHTNTVEPEADNSRPKYIQRNFNQLVSYMEYLSTTISNNLPDMLQ